MDTEQIIKHALDEDIGSGDRTTDGIIDTALLASAVIRVKEDALIAGIGIAEQVFKTIDPAVKFVPAVADGDAVKKGTAIANITGRASSLLKAERCAINFLMHLSGIATITGAYVRAIKGTGTVLLDTRKTTPGLRALEKYAVRAGGATNHRFGLFDGVLIKDNHIKAMKASGSITDGIKKMKRALPYHKIEIEVKTIEELKEAMLAGADILMLDNMDMDTMKRAIGIAKGKALIEVSGNITLDNIKGIARLNPDFISTGSITHSAKAIDISMKLTTIYTKETL
jgi:nicotinate-nucleotide pyrophosphorylase (carboxylating)